MAVVVSPHAERVSEILLRIRAVHCNPDEPYTFTSGWKSPVYVNCRRIFSTTWERREITQYMAQAIEAAAGRDGFDLVAGGETAGIPYAAWIADYFYRPMLYVRKKPKGFGLDRLIEGEMEQGARVVLVEDLMTDGMSKVRFAEALREAGARVDHAAVVFSYGVYPSTDGNLGGARLAAVALTDWRTTLAVAARTGVFDARQVEQVSAFLDDPPAWSKAHGGA